jgi:hypothetical protein
MVFILENGVDLALTVEEALLLLLKVLGHRMKQGDILLLLLILLLLIGEVNLLLNAHVLLLGDLSCLIEIRSTCPLVG